MESSRPRLPAQTALGFVTRHQRDCHTEGDMMKESVNAATGMLSGGTGGLGFLLGIQPILHLPSMLTATAGIVAFLGAMAVVVDSRYESQGMVKNCGRAILISILAFVLLFGLARLLTLLPAAGIF
jgi:hypothetical protein